MSLQPRILLLEDSDDTRELLMRALEMLDFRVECTSTGEDAIKKLESDATKPDLILTDLNLPEMSGADFISAVKSRNLAPKSKIVILSAKRGVRETADALGIDGGIQKPVDLDKLDTELRSILAS